MNVYPTKSEFVKLAQEGDLIPVSTDLMADFETPVSVYAKLSESGPAFMLESIEGGVNVNRYSFIGCDPKRIIRSYINGNTTITERDGSEKSFPSPQDPLTVVEEEMARYKPVKLENMPRFVGGAVGYLSYEYISCVEPTVPVPEDDPLKMPVLHFMIIDTLVVFDRVKQTLKLLKNTPTGDDPAAAYDEAVKDLETLSGRLERGRKVPTLPVPEETGFEVPQGNFEKKDFEQMVESCKEYVRAGDSFQIVGSQRFEKYFAKKPLSLYRSLRIVNPSPYMFLYDPGDFALVGASPEVHVRLTDGVAELRPIAGTRPRGKNHKEDVELEKDLLADKKECAEHLMLVDLARNDLGRVCTYGSVHVPDFMIIERYSHVMHIVSQVEGDISPEKNACDLMRATFPAGTVSGAPKVRAMQIISEQEKQQRGPYAGAVAYFSYGGNLDSCIAIRTAVLKDKKLYVQSGAGLVADSVPENEYYETINKAKGMLKAVALAEQMDTEV